MGLRGSDRLAEAALHVTDQPQLTADYSDRPKRGPTDSMEVAAFIDLICPRCYIAVRYLYDALAMFEHRDDVRIAWRSFQLDALNGRSFDELLILDVMRNQRMNRADASDVAASVLAKLREAAARAGLVYPQGTTTSGDTLAAHRILQLAVEHGVAGRALERIQQGYFEHGIAIDDRGSLAALAAELGIDADTAREVAFGDAYTDAVLADRDEATRRGIWSVPFFICDERFVSSGAQSPRWLHEMMKRCWNERGRENT